MKNFFRRINDRMGLMSKMMKKSNLDMSKLAHADMDSDYRKAVFRCLKCKNSEECVNWVSQDNEKSSAPGFCPNSEYLYQ